MSKSNSVGFYVTCVMDEIGRDCVVRTKYGDFYIEVDNYDNLSSKDKYLEFNRSLNDCFKNKWDEQELSCSYWAPVNIFRL